jgi:hypothetical protein
LTPFFSFPFFHLFLLSPSHPHFLFIYFFFLLTSFFCFFLFL